MRRRAVRRRHVHQLARRAIVASRTRRARRRRPRSARQRSSSTLRGCRPSPATRGCEPGATSPSGRRRWSTRSPRSATGIARRATQRAPRSAGWRAGPRGSPTACASTSSTTGGAASSRSAIGSPTPTGPGRARRLVLRPAGLGSAARQFRRDRQRRRAAASLVPPRTPGHQHRRPRHADVVGRHDVRVPDAAAADAQLPGHAARPELPRQRPAARSSTASERGVPWGISESAYAFTDRAGNYQYKAFGVPGLGLKRGLADDLVVAPYATALASLVDPAAAARTSRGSRATGSTAASASTSRSTTSRAQPSTPTAPPPGRRPGARSCARSSRITRACRSSRWPTCCCDDVFVHAVPRRSAGAGDRAAAAGARAARGDLSPSRGPRKAPRRAAGRRRCSRRGGSGRRTRPARTPISCRTAATPPRSRTRAAAPARGAACRSRGSARTAPRTPARTSSTSAIRGRATSGRPRYQPICREPDEYEATFELEKATFRGATATSKRSCRSSSRRKTTSKSAGCRSPTAATGRARSRSRATRRSCSRVPRTTSRIRRSASCSSRPSTTRRARACCSAGGRDRPTRHTPGRSTCSAVDGRLGGAVEWETDRAQFLGRGRSTANPSRSTAARCRERPARCWIRWPRCASACGWRRARSCASPSRPASPPIATTALALVRKYRDASAASRAFSMAFTHAHITLQHLGLTDDQAMLFDRLASRVFGSDASCTSPDDLARNIVRPVQSLGLRHLRAICRSCWSASRDAERHPARAAAAARAGVLARQGPARRRRHPQRSSGRLSRRGAGAAHGLLQEPRWSGWLDKPGGMFLLRVRRHARRRPPPALAAVARIVLRGDLGDLAPQLDRKAPWLSPAEIVPPIERAAAAEPAAAAPRPPRGSWTTASADSRPTDASMSIVLDGDRETPLPWSNVLANPEFGTVLSSVGRGLHLGRQQPREPAHAVRQRSDHRSRPAKRSSSATRTTATVWGATPGAAAAHRASRAAG